MRPPTHNIKPIFISFHNNCTCILYTNISFTDEVVFSNVSWFSDKVVYYSIEVLTP